MEGELSDLLRLNDLSEEFSIILAETTFKVKNLQVEVSINNC